MGVYEDLGLEPIINASGAVTRLGGAPMADEVLKSFCAAAADSVPLEQLQGAASRQIAEITGAEAGIVTCGAAAGLMLGTAAILTGYDTAKMERLPVSDGFANEFVVAREHRNGYDHAVRAAGARLVEVGFDEVACGAGVRRAEAWEYAAAFGAQAAGVLYVYQTGTRPPLKEVVSIAHSRGLPVLVDAAAELPPRSNLRDLIAVGADLVAFSGGKAIGGPQATGILCGRRSLVASAALQMLDMDDHVELWEPPAELIDKDKLPGLPRHGIGRALKVSKEQIIALLTALKTFAGQSDQKASERRISFLEKVEYSLAGLPVQCRLVGRAPCEIEPRLEITVDEAALGRSTMEVCRRLRHGHPPVYLGHAFIDQYKLVVNPIHLNRERTALLCRRLHEELTPPGSGKS
jgi:seryl-tRNA(Sec) selenium transferase